MHAIYALRLLEPKISIVFPKCHRTLAQIPHWTKLNGMNSGQMHTYKTYSNAVVKALHSLNILLDITLIPFLHHVLPYTHAQKK